MLSISSVLVFMYSKKVQKSICSESLGINTFINTFS